MNITIHKAVFEKVLSRIQGLTSGRATMPVLSNVLLEARGDRLIVTATDLETGYRTAVDTINVTQEGSITAPAKKLHEIVKSLPYGDDGHITFAVNPENCFITVSAGKARFNIAGIHPTDYPPFPAVSGAQFDLGAVALGRLLDLTLYCTSSDNTKYNLCGVFLQIADGKLNAVATDGHRLATAYVPLSHNEGNIPNELTRGIIVPKKGAQEIRKSLEAGIIVLQLAGNNLSIATDTETFIVRLVDGEFPDYRRVVPQNLNNKVRLFRLPLLAALRRVAIMSEGKSRKIDLSFKDGICDITSSNVEYGQALDQVPATIKEGEPFISHYNADYLMQALNEFESEEITFAVVDEVSPALVTACDEPDTFAVIMPMRG